MRPCDSCSEPVGPQSSESSYFAYTLNQAVRQNGQTRFLCVARNADEASRTLVRHAMRLLADGEMSFTSPDTIQVQGELRRLEPPEIKRIEQILKSGMYEVVQAF